MLSGEYVLMPLWKILVTGTTPMDVQGINLRESIAHVACAMRVYCKVRNKKGSNVVEIVCKCAGEAEANGFKDALGVLGKENKMVKMENVKIGELARYEDPALKESDVNGYDIEREDDLTEMVWALQNAGKALLLQEKLRKESLFRALDAEMEAFQQVIEQLEEKSSYGEFFPTVALEGFLGNPPEPPKGCENLMTKLHALYRYAKTVNHVIENGKDVKMTLDDLRKTLEEVKLMLKGVRFK